MFPGGSTGGGGNELALCLPFPVGEGVRRLGVIKLSTRVETQTAATPMGSGRFRSSEPTCSYSQTRLKYLLHETPLLMGHRPARPAARTHG